MKICVLCGGMKEDLQSGMIAWDTKGNNKRYLCKSCFHNISKEQIKELQSGSSN
jgi:hypothetical protein